MSKNDGDLAALGFLVNALDGGGDVGNLFPQSDAKDLSDGADHIPFAVTDARRAGETVTFVREGSREQWYWQMPNGSCIYHDR